MLNNGYILDEKYEVVKTLGQGGMSTVYLCRNTRLGNLWAIKEVKKELKGQIDFLAEPNILKNLSHPGIPRVVDIFYREDNLYIVEDYIEGETLQDYINKNGFIGIKQVNNIILNICNILEYLHSFNPPIIYRDLKPSNIMITSMDKIVLIDFGISRIYKQGGDRDTIYMGSKGYAAPEQYGMEQTCIQTDIYGLGAVMYFLVTGKASIALLEPLKDESYSNEIGIKLKKIIQKAMQIDIESRYSSVEEIKKELLNFSENEYETKTLFMQNSEEYCKTLFMDTNKSVFNGEAGNKLFGNSSIKTIVTDKSKFKDFSGIIDQEVHNEENNISTKANLNIGMINFYKVKANSGETEIEDEIVTLDNRESKVNRNNANDDKESKKSHNKFKIAYDKLKMNESKSKKSFKRKLASTLVFVLVILGLAYLVAGHEKGEQVINNDKITNGKTSDKATLNVGKPENQSQSDTKDVGNRKDNVNPSTDQTTSNKPNYENPAVNSVMENPNSKEVSAVPGKGSQNKKESKVKSNGKGKGKHKYDEGDQ